MYQISDDDVPFEETLLRHPFEVRHWLRYLEHKSDSSIQSRSYVYERAVQQLPRSYKLWHAYLTELRAAALVTSSDSLHETLLLRKGHWDQLTRAYENALVHLNTMPRLWIEYVEVLLAQKYVTKARRALDDALRALPVTQHGRIWILYDKLMEQTPLPELAVRIYRRMVLFDPSRTEDLIDALVEAGREGEAAKRLVEDIINKPGFASRRGKTRFEHWTDLCQIICQAPRTVSQSVSVEEVLRGALRLFSSELGTIWCTLAQFYVLMGRFERARNIYEEAILSVTTARDFGQIFDAYAKFEEALIESQMSKDLVQDAVLDWHLARLEDLMQKRPFLLSDVLLRQNPHNVYEWQKRVALHQDDLVQIVATYKRAFEQIDPRQAVGPLHSFWIAYAQHYVDAKDWDNAKSVFERAVQCNFRFVDDLASVWCAFADMEVERGAPERALALMSRATSPPAGGFKRSEVVENERATAQSRLCRSLTLWEHYLDLEETFGTLDTTKAAYERLLEWRLCTPQIIVNYATLLTANEYFEEAFRVYERGIDMFGYPIAFDLWNTYLAAFIARYGGKKLERARDLFERACEGCPAKNVKALFVMYGKLEEEHGLAGQALRIYERACAAVAPEDRLEMYRFYISKAAEMFGLTATRPIYDAAIGVLPDKDLKDLCLEYAALETRLGEVDRARAIYAHGAQCCDPRLVPLYWQSWQSFEVQHGNEDTFREMLRIKRSVQAKYSTQVAFVAATNAGAVPAASVPHPMAALEQDKKESSISFISADKSNTTNPDEIEIQMEDNDDEEEEANNALTEDAEASAVGARERFLKRQRVHE